MPMRPDSPCALVPGTARFATRRAFGSPLSNTRRLPTRSDTSIRPSGRNATSHGRESPICTTSSRIVGTFGTGVGDGDAVRAGAVVAAPVPDGDPAGAAGEGEGAATGAHAAMTSTIARAAGLTRPLSPLVRGGEDTDRRPLERDDVRDRERVRAHDRDRRERHDHGSRLLKTVHGRVQLVSVRGYGEVNDGALEVDARAYATIAEIDRDQLATVHGRDVQAILTWRYGYRTDGPGDRYARHDGVLLRVDDVDRVRVADRDVDTGSRAIHRHCAGGATQRDRVRRASAEVQVEQVQAALGADKDVVVLVGRCDASRLLRVREELGVPARRVDLLSAGAAHHEGAHTVAVRRDDPALYGDLLHPR